MSTNLIKETHVSWVVFIGDRAYKVKKPVAFRFLDWTTVEAREEACRSEVLLNRRLSPDVYLGVGHFTPPGGASEPVVVMRRMPEGTALSDLIQKGDPSLPRRIEEVAEVLATFHAGAVRGPGVDRDCTLEAVTQLWRGNVEELGAVPGSPVPERLLTEANGLAEAWLRGRGPLFAERLGAGRAVDGHGDLLCDDTYCTADGVRVLDCLEFDPALRHGDVVSDLASLAMDMERLGRPDLAGLLTRAYQARAEDVWPRSLTDFWISYRALVRAKVGCYRYAGASGAEADKVREDVDRLVALALDHLRSARIRVVLVGGLPGTGKTTLARRLGERTGWEVLGSDAIRRATGGVAPGLDTRAPYGEGLYTPARLDANYRALIEAAGERVGHGEPVILDASWSRVRWRRAVESMARERYADVIGLECVAPPEVTRQRMLARRAAGDQLSDATPEVASDMAATREPWPEAVTVDTSRPDTEAILGAALDVLDARDGGEG